MKVAITGAGVYDPPYEITNEELVEAFNAYADAHNVAHAEAIARGDSEALRYSSAEFIAKASGIRSRRVYVKDGILDMDRMCPRIPKRSAAELGHQAEFGLRSARLALEAARKRPEDIDMVIVSCAYTERAYPAIAIEIQDALGIEGVGYDMLVACSAATFGLHRAYEAIAAGSARAVLCVNPELMSPQINYRDRDSHFIFGDVSTSVVLERADLANAPHVFDILGVKAMTRFSSNIRSNFGHLARAEGGDPFAPDRLFHQEGRKVFKEVCPMAVAHLEAQMAEVGMSPHEVRRWWLHQANVNMNQLVCRRLLGEEPTPDRAPLVLDRYANTASAGSVLAFAHHHQDLRRGDVGVLCSFGAGYSIGSLAVRKR